MADYVYRARASAHLTVSTTAKALADFGFSAANMAAAEFAAISPISDGVNYLHSGDTPTPTFGHPIVEDGTVTIRGNSNITALQFIRNGSSDAEVTITLGW